MTARDPRERLLSVTDAAAHMHVDRKQVQRWIKAGLLTVIPDGNLHLIRLSHLNQLKRERGQQRLPPGTL